MKTPTFGSRFLGIEAILFCLAAAVFAIVWTMSNGRDLNWDFLNYHVYTGFASLHDRLNQDYFPANIQSYLLGYAYVPLYFAVVSGWETWKVQALLGLMCVPTLFATWWLSQKLAPGPDARSALWRMGMVAAALSSPLLLMELGTSFADAWTAAFVLVPMALLLGTPETPGNRAVIVAGVLAGIGAALKMTNMVMAAPLVLLLLWLPGKSRARQWNAAMLFTAACAVGFILIYAYHGARLYERFGNPFFPIFMNEWFRPAEFGLQSIALDRFKAQSLSDFLLRPVHMLDLVAGLYTEAGAPDARYVALIALAGGYATQVGLRQLERDRRIEAIALWIAITWVLWMLSSGNGRYGVPLAMVAGLLAVAITRQLWHSRSPHLAPLKAFCMALAVLHLVSLVHATHFRWDGRQDEQRQYFAPQVKAVLKDTPFVIVNSEHQSISWLAPFVHADSRFTSPLGQHNIRPDSPAGHRLATVLNSGMPILVSHRSRITKEFPLHKALTTLKMDRYVGLHGLKPIEGADCHVVHVDRSINPGTRQTDPEYVDHLLLLCPATYDAELSQQTAKRFGRHDVVLDCMERACPKLFSPAGVQSVCTDNLCARLYVNTDISLMAYEDGGIVALGYKGIQPAFFGYKGDILAGSHVSCARPGRFRPFSAGGSAFQSPD